MQGTFVSHHRMAIFKFLLNLRDHIFKMLASKLYVTNKIEMKRVLSV